MCQFGKNSGSSGAQARCLSGAGFRPVRAQPGTVWRAGHFLKINGDLAQLGVRPCNVGKDIHFTRSTLTIDVKRTLQSPFDVEVSGRPMASISFVLSVGSPAN